MPRKLTNKDTKAIPRRFKEGDDLLIYSRPLKKYKKKHKRKSPLERIYLNQRDEDEARGYTKHDWPKDD